MAQGSVGVALLITVVLIFINGTLASAELAMMGLSEHKLKAQAKEGDKKAALLLKMKQSPTNFLSTVQIGITLAGLLSGAFAADSLAAPLILFAADQGLSGVALYALRAGVTFLVTLLMTFFMLVFGELVPKRIAMAKAEATARRVVGPIHLLSKVTKPLVALLSVTTNGVLRLLGVDPKQGEDVTEEDILLLMHAGLQQGKIEDLEVELAQNLFAFTDLQVKDAMTHRTELVSLPVDGDLPLVVSTMSRTGYNKFPVVDGTIDHIVGMVYTKDIVSHYDFGSSNVPMPKIRDLMRPPLFVSSHKMLVDLFGEMKRSHERIAVVVDEYGGTAGIISLMNILEELVGDMSLDQANAGLTEISPGVYRIDGLVDMDLVAKSLGLSGKYSGTLSSFLISLLNYIPLKSETPRLRYQGILFQIEEMAGGRVRWVRAETLSEKEVPAVTVS